jgi:hypothetical protein
MQDQDRISMGRPSEDGPVFRVFLEKKGRARGALSLFTGKPWATRTFKLKKQVLQYFDKNELRGQVNIAGAEIRMLSPSDADNKVFPFSIKCTDGERLILNASCEDIRARCLQVFRKASVTSQWVLPRGMSRDSKCALDTNSDVDDDGGGNSNKGTTKMLAVHINDRETRTLWFYEAVNEGTLQEVQDLYDNCQDLIVVDYVSPEVYFSLSLSLSPVGSFVFYFC